MQAGGELETPAALDIPLKWYVMVTLTMSPAVAFFATLVAS